MDYIGLLLDPLAWTPPGVTSTERGVGGRDHTWTHKLTGGEGEGEKPWGYNIVKIHTYSDWPESELNC